MFREQRKSWQSQNTNENHEIHEKHRIPKENQENHENHRIQNENNENHENHRILKEHIENHENLKQVHAIIMKIIQFDWRIMKTYENLRIFIFKI